MASTHTNKRLTRYHVVFGIVLIIMMIIIALIKISLKDGLTGVSMITPYLVSMFVGEHFIKRERRLPTASEKDRLVWGGLIIFIALEIFFLALGWVSGVFEDEIPTNTNATAFLIIIVAIYIFVVLVNYFLMRWAYGSLLTKRANKLKIDIQ